MESIKRIKKRGTGNCAVGNLSRLRVETDLSATLTRPSQDEPRIRLGQNRWQT